MFSRLISAICTPIRDDHSLDVAGLEAHIEDQWNHGISGLLVAGTMGLMQLQSDSTYRSLIQQSVHISRGRGEIMVGVGDTCFSRTRERILLASQFQIDAVVVVSPYLVKFSQLELIDYFSALANESPKPVYLYDLPQLTGIKLDLDTIDQLSRHPNIDGIKCSVSWDDIRQIVDRVEDRLRVIPAQPNLVDLMVRLGMRDNLDGVFSIAPSWATCIIRAAEAGNWTRAASLQQQLSQLLQALRSRYSIYGGCETILNARGICHRITPSPMRRLSDAQREQLLSEPLVKELLANAQRGESS